MWKKWTQLLCAGLVLFAGSVVAAAETTDPRVLTKAEFQAVAVEGLKAANGISREEAANRFREIMEAARTYPGKSKLARKVRTGYGHYEESRNIRKKHVKMILGVFTDAQVAAISAKEADAVLSAWPAG
jgi:hypothetical protein